MNAAGWNDGRALGGTQATLNARTSILAAANPQGGRYDPRRSLKVCAVGTSTPGAVADLGAYVIQSNVNMSPAILSRFDLFFVLIDACEETADYNIARHILDVHRRGLVSVKPEFSTEQLQRYIKYARAIKPRVRA
jgi:DNA replication licensing factor MCM6